MNANNLGDAQSLRTCYVRGDADGMLGLHLSRAPWDPYPWVSSVQNGSSAAEAGIKVGDCVLEVNGADVLGEKIVEVAERIRSNWSTDKRNSDVRSAEVPENGVTFLLWNSKADNNLNPHSLQKFTTCLQNVAQLLECPICLDVVKPPAWQCCHGHVLCVTCRSRTTRCPICRVSLGPRGRCLIADQLFTLLAETFPCENKDTPHSRCTSSTPCSRAISHTQTKNNKISNNVKSVAAKTSASPTLRLHCPTGKSCGRLSSVHDLLTHLQKAHRTTVTQYYSSLGDRVSVRFVADRTIAAIAIPKNGQLQLFLVMKAKRDSATSAPLGSNHACWIWCVGDGATAAAHHVRLECHRVKWRGAAVSLERSLKEVLDGGGEDCAMIEESAGAVSVEIK